VLPDTRQPARKHAGQRAAKYCFAGDVEAWRQRGGLDCGDQAELPESYRLEISGDVEAAARWWQAKTLATPLVAG